MSPIATPPSIHFDRLDKLPEMKIVHLFTDDKPRIHWFHPEVSIWLAPSQLRELAKIVNAAILASERAPAPAQLPLPFPRSAS